MRLFVLFFLFLLKGNHMTIQPPLRPLASALCVLMLLSACSSLTQSKEEKAAAAMAKPSTLTPQAQAEARAKILAMRDESVKELMLKNPKIKADIEKSVGYAVFDVTQINVILGVGAYGKGVVTDKNGKVTFMTANRLGTGPGVGYKSARQLMIFKNQTFFDQFVKLGADVNASADATFKLGDKGSALDPSLSFNTTVDTYQYTSQGVLLQANWGGVAYLIDSDLNNPTVKTAK
jgi:lipid-binding SYLF domain-containing protein